MKKFKFRLQTLLDQRIAKEERLLIELGEIRRKEAEEIARLERLRARLVEADKRIERAINEGEPVENIVRADEYAKSVRDDIKVQELTVEAVRRQVEVKRLEVVKAMQDRQVLEALRDKQEREYIQAMMRAEQNQLDEMASVRFARGM